MPLTAPTDDMHAYLNYLKFYLEFNQLSQNSKFANIATTIDAFINTSAIMIQHVREIQSNLIDLLNANLIEGRHTKSPLIPFNPETVARPNKLQIKALQINIKYIRAICRKHPEELHAILDWTELLLNLKDPKKLNFYSLNELYNMLKEQSQYFPMLCEAFNEDSLFNSIAFADLKFSDLQTNHVLLGKGAFGNITEYYSPTEAIAVKDMIDPRNAEKFILEGQLPEQFSSSEHLLKTRVLINEQGHPFIISRAMNGGSLYHYLTETGIYLDQSQQLELFETCLQAVLELHQSGFIHRDVAARNFLVEINDQNKITAIKLADFGETRTINNDGMYERQFNIDQHDLSISPPSKLRDELYDTPATDLWALGMLLYEIANNGLNPFLENAFQVPGSEASNKTLAAYIDTHNTFNKVAKLIGPNSFPKLCLHLLRPTFLLAENPDATVSSVLTQEYFSQLEEILNSEKRTIEKRRTALASSLSQSRYCGFYIGENAAADENAAKIDSTSSFRRMP